MCPKGVSANLTVSQTWVTPRSSCLPGHTFAGSKDQLGFLAFCLCYKKYVNIYLSKGRIGPRSTQGCSDSSVHMISFNLYLHRAPHSSVRGRILIPYLQRSSVPSLWVHKLWVASGCTFYMLFCWKDYRIVYCRSTQKGEEGCTKTIRVPLNTSPVAAAHP